MVQQQCFIMTFEYMFTHDLIISQGYDPRVGELFPRGFKEFYFGIWDHCIDSALYLNKK
jgi:hypothetical protein